MESHYKERGKIGGFGRLTLTSVKFCYTWLIKIYPGAEGSTTRGDLDKI